ncbi:MAG: cell division protein SepF [Candidatus Heimdallarchaeota archaeon]|nr:cell division protein SepF [Candidatus Heimdallarchaeota archaeon]
MEDKQLALLTTLGIIGLGTVIGTSVFLFRKRPKDNYRFDEQREVLTLTLRGLQDVDMICETVSKGNVVILGVRDLARLDMIRLKRSVQQLKSYTRSYGGDILALGKDFIVVVPASMKLSLIKRLVEESAEFDDFDPPDPPTEVGTI